MKNLSKLYYQDYYKNIDFLFLLDDNVQATQQQINEQISEQINEIKRRNQELCGPNVLKVIDNPAAPQDHRFKLQICYPGLVTGVGVNHEAKLEGEFKLGMHFDWTWGMPVVYGSSVKGVLKTYFKDFFLEHYSDRNNDVKSLMNLIFEGKNPNEGKNNEPKHVSIYERDVFFDAVIVKSNDKGKFLEDDYITPHPDPLKNPVPIKMLKIASGCTMEFRFKLSTCVINGNVYNADSKLKIFEDILTTVGIGAKTNVGYGQLMKVD